METTASIQGGKPANGGKLLHGVAGQRVKQKVPLGTPPRPAFPTTPGSGAGNFPNMLYQGGPVIHNPNVYVVFVGDWTSAANQTRATRLTQFVTDFLSSSFMNILSQYGCGSSGTVAGSVFLPNTATPLTHSDIVTLLQNAIDSTTPATQLPEPAGSDMYILYLDDNTAVNDTTNGVVLCEATSNAAFGYHAFFTTTAGNRFYFAIVPGLTNSCLADGCPGGDSGCPLQSTQTQEQRQTTVSSHELSEMMTDPEIAPSFAISKLAWYDDVDTNGEIGDVCAGNFGTITVGPNTWSVQPIFSKTDDQNTNGATTCVASEPFPLPSLLPSVSLILDRSTFGKDEVNAVLAHSASDKFQDAFYVIVDGYTPDELGISATNLTAPPNLPTFTGTFSTLGDPAIAFDSSTGVQLDQLSNLFIIQRITFPFNVTFSSVNAFTNLSLTNPSATYSLSAQIVNTNDSAGYPVVTSPQSATAELELVFQADPFMNHGENWWLSDDMRVFQYTPAAAPSTIPLKYSSTAWTGNPNTYVHNLLAELNKSFTDPTLTNTPFAGISSDEDQSYLNLTGNDSHGNPVYNFALARVHLQGDTANNVRTFFRLFISSSPDTDFNTGTTFRSSIETDSMGNPIPGTLIPLLGYPDSDMSSTIPFFAAPRIDSTTQAMTQQPDPDNVQTIPSPTAPAPVPGAEVYAYFGCWLDLNQSKARFPLNPSTQAKPDGPYPAADILSIPALIMSNHACLVAEIAYDSDPIPSGANASSSDKIGQRNLSWSASGNPGPIEGHIVPTLFDLKLTSPEVPQNQLPDELMIEWGQVPVGSLASIFWPQVDAGKILNLSNRHYTFNKLTQKDAHTIQCKTGSVTYIPIPAGTGPNLAGLLTIDLPAGVRTGQQFDVVVRRLRSRNIKGGFRTNAQAAALNAVDVDTINWRYVVGAFQIRIPVAADPLLLEPEESLLALFKWKLESIPTTNRWHPVIERFIQQTSGRVNAWGGNASGIPPSQLGYPVGAKGGHGHPHHHHDCFERTGKVSGVIYDRFGDFEGFILLTEQGYERRYWSHEEEIEQLVRYTWEERTVISVFANHHHPETPISIILRKTPRSI